MKMLLFFLAKCVRNAVKTMVVDRKNQKALALLYLALKPLRKAANSSGVPTEFEQNRRGKFDFSPEPYRLIFSPKLNFSPSTKKTTECSFELYFSINEFVFDFCCLCLFCYNAGQHAISRQEHTGFSTGLYPVYEVYWYPCGADGRMYGRTDGRSRDYYVTTKISWLDRLPNFLSNGAPLTR